MAEQWLSTLLDYGEEIIEGDWAGLAADVAEDVYEWATDGKKEDEKETVTDPEDDGGPATNGVFYGHPGGPVQLDPEVFTSTSEEGGATTMAANGLPVGAIVSFRGRRWKVLPGGKMIPYSRRRRRRCLTAQDRADIAFLKGQLGTGALGQAAISALLTSCSR